MVTDRKFSLKRRIPYLISFVILLLIEIFIGAFARDNFIRPFLGDVLVTALLCCFVRVFAVKWNPLPLAVFSLAAGVEVLQFFKIDRLLGIEDTVLGAVVGSTFDFADILCYAVGCLLFFLTECVIIKCKS